MTPALSISHLRKVYRRGTVGVEDLSLDVAPGDFFGFLGPNGAGKSTTIHCVTGIANPSSGRIEVFGVDAVKQYRDARRLIGLSPQEFNVDSFANARDIVDWMGGYFGMNSVQRRARVDMLLEKFDLVQHAKKRFRELSGGLKRRVMLARAMVNDPALLILDEPTAGVDVELRRDMRRWNASAVISLSSRAAGSCGRDRRRNSSASLAGWKRPICARQAPNPITRRRRRHERQIAPRQLDRIVDDHPP
jgi:ABC-2 type transport system ATP-binding protein